MAPELIKEVIKFDIGILTIPLVCFVFTAVMAASQSIVVSIVGTFNDSEEMCVIRDAKRGFLVNINTQLQ